MFSGVYRLRVDGSRDLQIPDITPTPAGIPAPSGTEFVGGSHFLRFGLNGALHSALDLSPDFRPIAALTGGRLLAVNDYRIILFRADGTQDGSFAPNLLGTAADLASVLARPDATLIIAGNFTAVGGVPRPGIARLLPTGELDSSFVPPNDVPRFDYFWEGPIVGLVRLNPANGKIVLAGLSRYDDKSEPIAGSMLARLNAARGI